MNKIKDSFSKIKASDEFKDKLERELLNDSMHLKSNTKRLYYIPSIKVAAVLLLVVGFMSFKFAINAFSKGSTNSESIAYAPNDEITNNNSTTTKDNTQNETYALEDNSNKSNQDLNKIKDNTINKSTNSTTSINDNKDKLSSNNEEQSSKDSYVNINSNSALSNENVNSPTSKETADSKQGTIPSSDSDKTEMKALNSTMQDVSINLVYIPKIEIPKIHEGITTKMIPLIVYKGNVYTYTSTEIDSKDANNFLGRKIGTTTGNINEWSTQSDYSINLASNIGNTDVYAVNGYDEDFRIMTNITLKDGTIYPEIYECLNGITLKTGQDFFGKLKLQGNIASAKFQTFTDWNNGNGTSYSINDIDLLNSFVEGLNNSTPYLPEAIEPSLGDYRNEDGCKQIYLNLKDGCKNISFTVLKSGYVYYGNYPTVYFKIDTKLTTDIWDKLGVVSTY